jgi:thioredoxin 2
MVAANHMVCPSCQALNRVPVDRPAVQAKCGSCHAPLFAGAPLAIDEAGFERHLAWTPGRSTGTRLSAWQLGHTR